MDKIIERKIRYDAKMVEYECMPVIIQEHSAVLFYLIRNSFTMSAGHQRLTIPEGGYTTAYYWTDRPYNLYYFRNHHGRHLGSYFNIVRNTTITGGMVSYEDLIVDVLVLPSGEVFILDEDELPEPIDRFEKGYVKQALTSLMESVQDILSAVKSDTETIFRHERFIPLLDGFANSTRKKHTAPSFWANADDGVVFPVPGNPPKM